MCVLIKAYYHVTDPSMNSVSVFICLFSYHICSSFSLSSWKAGSFFVLISCHVCYPMRSKVGERQSEKESERETESEFQQSSSRGRKPVITNTKGRIHSCLQLKHTQVTCTETDLLLIKESSRLLKASSLLLIWSSSRATWYKIPQHMLTLICWYRGIVSTIL